MRELINIISLLEDPTLKKQVIQAVNDTDDQSVLGKVLNTLKAGNIHERVAQVLSADEDAAGFVNKIAKIFVEIESPIEEKNDFLDKYPKGIVNTSRLLDGKQHSFKELLGSDFATKLFVALSVELVSQGVGPGEVALAVMSPKINWSGRKVGGGDIQVGNKSVEVKTSVKSGGRWVNARKARMQLSALPDVIQSYIEAVANKAPEKVSKLVGDQLPSLPARLSIGYWVNTIRPIIALDPASLRKLSNSMASALFNQADNKQYVTALEKGNEEQIKEAILNVGFNNYKAYSNFDGILMMDVSSQSSQYFRDYESMKGHIKVDSAYIYAPESEAMPKVTLLSSGGATVSTTSDAAQPAKAAKSNSPAKPKTGKDLGIVHPSRAKRAPEKTVTEPTRQRR